jgi:hypothetical protein
MDDRIVPTLRLNGKNKKKINPSKPHPGQTRDEIKRKRNAREPLPVSNCAS